MRKLALILMIAHFPLHFIMPAADLILHLGIGAFLWSFRHG